MCIGPPIQPFFGLETCWNEELLAVLEVILLQMLLEAPVCFEKFSFLAEPFDGKVTLLVVFPANFEGPPRLTKKRSLTTFVLFKVLKACFDVLIFIALDAILVELLCLGPLGLWALDPRCP